VCGGSCLWDDSKAGGLIVGLTDTRSVLVWKGARAYGILGVNSIG